jgi:hypothetical protein
VYRIFSSNESQSDAASFVACAPSTNPLQSHFILRALQRWSRHGFWPLTNPLQSHFLYSTLQLVARLWGTMADAAGFGAGKVKIYPDHPTATSLVDRSGIPDRAWWDGLHRTGFFSPPVVGVSNAVSMGREPVPQGDNSIL